MITKLANTYENMYAYDEHPFLKNLLKNMAIAAAVPSAVSTGVWYKRYLDDKAKSIRDAHLILGRTRVAEQLGAEAAKSRFKKNIRANVPKAAGTGAALGAAYALANWICNSL